MLPAVSALVPVVMGANWLVELDHSVADGLHDVVRDSSITVDVLGFVTFFGTSLALYTMVGLAALASLIRRRPRLAVFVIAVSTSGGILNHLLKDLFGRERPSFPDPVAHGGGPSFPSGHAMNSAIVFVAVVLVLLALGCYRHRALFAGLAAGVIAAIGFTRMALGVHYLSDVVGGWVFAGVWVAFLSQALGVRPPVRWDRGEMAGEAATQGQHRQGGR